MKIVQRVQLVCEWRYLFLVIASRRERLLWVWIGPMQSEALAAAVNGLKHRTAVGTVCHRQPAYSSELNPVERVFVEVRRWVEGWVCGCIEGKVAAVNSYLGALEADPGRVRSLAGWDWTEDTIQRLPSHYTASSMCNGISRGSGNPPPLRGSCYIM